MSCSPSIGANADSTRQLSDANPWLREIQLAEQEPITTRSKDGTVVHGFLMRPGATGPASACRRSCACTAAPCPNGRTASSFRGRCSPRSGYAVVGMNPRGSSGRGFEWAKAIFAHWGEKDVQDVLSGVDYAVAHGIADPKRLGVGGWSYGGELTDYVIASDTRFKAAIAGAGIGNVLAGFGTDQYVREYTQELGATVEASRQLASRLVPLSARRSNRDANVISWSAIRTSTSRSRTPSRCTRHSAHSASRASS